MTSEVIIDVQPKDISIALLEDKTLVEYQKEQRTASFSVGNIYVAKVKKLMPGLNACFVDVGAERVAFLHYLDLGSQFCSYEKYLKQVVSDRKKLYPIQCRVTGQNAHATYWFPWPIIRLSDLYLLYAEAINEAEGPNGPHKDDLFHYLDAIRERAGIPDVKTSWDTYSNNPGYYNTQYGMRDIIHTERLVELCFESQRFWDIRRWKEVANEYQKGIYGFTITGSAPEDYYSRRLVAAQTFGLKDYFWPISTTYIDRNPNLVQNLGW